MNSYIALFRGINVGGYNRLPMKGLKAIMENIGHQNIKTYIQSGNVIFRTDQKNKEEISDKIGSEVKKKHGFKPAIILVELEEMKKAIAANPFPEAEHAPKSLHLFFLASRPLNPDLNALESVKNDNERFELKGKIFYLHAPAGIGRSKLAGKTEQALGVSITARNWRTVQKIMEMIETRFTD